MNKVKEPETISYLTNNSNLRFPIHTDSGVVKIQFRDCKITLNKNDDKELISAMNKLIDEQWAKDGNGDFVLDENGARIVASNKIRIPFWYNEEFEASIVKDDQPIKMSDGKGGFVEITPEEVRELSKKKETLKEDKPLEEESSETEKPLIKKGNKPK